MECNSRSTRFDTIDDYKSFFQSQDYDCRKAIAPCGTSWNPRSLCF